MAIAGGLLAVRFVAGPLHWPLVSVNSPVNAAAATAVAWMLLTLMAAGKPARPAGPLERREWIALGVLAAAIVAAFCPNLRAPFVFDDYTHIVDASHASWRTLADLFKPVPGGHGLFFRPIGFTFYWLDYHWAGRIAARWHVWSLAAHVVNSSLLYVIVRRLRMGRAAAFTAALLFALGGSRAETVAWADARFDLLATLFTFCALLATLEYCRAGRRVYCIPLIVCAALAVYTKESAFCLPLLPLALLPVLERAERRRAIAASLALGAVCTALFAYRWRALGGLGGYIDHTGASAVWHSRPLHSAEALFYRQWAFLFFPVNWAAPLEWWLRVAAVVFIAALVICAGRAGAPRAHLLAGIAFLLAADVPVQHLLMFQTDFAGARVLYLPLAGLAIFWGALLERPAPRRSTWALVSALVAFNVAALEHNLGPWRATPAAAAAACGALGREMAHDPRPVFVRDVPERRLGVYFLANGFPQCVELNSGQPAGRVHLAGQADRVPTAARLFIWNPERGAFEEKR